MVPMTVPETTTCCIVGGGPAGVILGYLLARAGVGVIVLEKHADFLRDFRGDTIHPSTLQLLDELDLLEDVLQIVDFRAEKLTVNIEGKTFIGPVFTHLKTQCPFIGFVPQWDFLNLLTCRAKRFPAFDLRMSTKAIDVLREEDRVVGVRCETDEGRYDIRADLVVAADGRSSTVRDVAGHGVREQGIPIDVLWFRLDRPADVDDQTLAWLKGGRMLVTIPRRDHYQVAMVICKGAFDQIKSEGFGQFREAIGLACPLLKTAARQLDDWQQIKLLTVQINAVDKWYESGLLIIGDAAHAMSPVGGVGINLAIQDAVAAANLLTDPLRNGSVGEAELSQVQQRREPAARKTQRLQSIIHSNLFGRGSAPGRPFSVPWYVRLLILPLAPLLRRLAGRWIGLGFQPEHVAHRESDD